MIKIKYFLLKKKRRFDHYLSKCPYCKNNICCFCSKIIEKRDLFSRYIEKFCCFKRTFYFIFFRETYQNDKYPMICFILGYIAFIIPLFSCLGLFLCIIYNLFRVSKSKDLDLCLIDAYERKNECLFYCTKFIIFGFSFCMSICFSMLCIIYILTAFIFSIPFKFTPLTNLIFYVSENSF